jgi:hypothetical protein
LRRLIYSHHFEDRTTTPLKEMPRLWIAATLPVELQTSVKLRTVYDEWMFSTPVSTAEIW